MSHKTLTRPIIIRLLAISLSLVCLNAFSYGVRKIAILKKKDSKDTDTYTVKPYPKSPYTKCIKDVYPSSITTIPGYEHGKTINITYLSNEQGCGSQLSRQEFVIQSIQHPSRRAYFMWMKAPSRDPEILIFPATAVYHLIWFNDKDPRDIKIWISCVNKYCK